MEMLEMPKKKFYTIIIAKQVHRVQRLLRRLDLFYFCSHISSSELFAFENFLRASAIVISPLRLQQWGKWAAIESEGENWPRDLELVQILLRSEKPFWPSKLNGISFRFRGSTILIHYLHNTEAISRSAPLSSFIFDLLFYSRLLPFDAKIINLDHFDILELVSASLFFWGKSRRFASLTQAFPSQNRHFHIFNYFLLSQNASDATFTHKLRHWKAPLLFSIVAQIFYQWKLRDLSACASACCCGTEQGIKILRFLKIARN